MVPGRTGDGDEKTPRPNLVFLLADDLRWNALGCMGDEVVQTPLIDRLAAEGTRFRNAFVTTSICCVNRASILSGQHVRRHRTEDSSTLKARLRFRPADAGSPSKVRTRTPLPQSIHMFPALLPFGARP